MDADGRGLLHGDLTETIISVFFEVYNEVGYGFLESVYQNSMLVAFAARGVATDDEARIRVWFRGREVGRFRADILVDNTVIVELETARSIDAAHKAKLLNYLRATDKEVGLLLNFGPKPEFQRFVFQNERKKTLGGFIARKKSPDPR